MAGAGARAMTAIDTGENEAAAKPTGKRLLSHLFLISMRLGSTVSKFLLAIYTARYLGLADLGIYGLLASATTFVPAIVGAGMTQWLMRNIVDVPRAQALPLIAGRLSMILLIHLVLWPLALAVNWLAGEPIPMEIAALCGAILVFENLGYEAFDMLLARRRVLLAYLIGFLRTGVWPIPVMVLGLLYPEMRTLEWLLIGWLSMQIACMLVVVALALPEGRWRFMKPRDVGTRMVFLFGNLHRTLPLFVKDLGSVTSMFLDRFLISIFVGLELTGVYTLFWSIANVLHSLTVHGVLQAQLPQMMATAHSGNPTSFRALERHLQFEVGAWSLLLAAGVAVATPLMLPYLNQPLLHDYLAVFWIILFATLLRIAADAYGFALLALHQDRAIAIVAVAGGVASAILNLILTPLAGIWGAATAFVATSAGLFVARYILTRQAIAKELTGRPFDKSFGPDYGPGAWRSTPALASDKSD